MKKALITGITGQDGAYLTKFLLEKGYEVFGLSRSSQPDMTNLNYLGIADRVTIDACNLLDLEDIKQKIVTCNPDEIYNLAAQSSVDYSFREPVETLNYNINSVVNILESIRQTNEKIKLYQASTCEIYGTGNTLPIRDDSSLSPSSPYGVSKAAGHLLIANYRETYGLFCVSGILFNHESHLRKPNYFIRRLIRTAIEISEGKDEYIRLGQADNRRDFGYSPDYVQTMWLMLQNDTPKDYLVCSGVSVSIREITEYVLNKFNVSLDRITIDPTLFRTPNVPDLYGDARRIKEELGWDYEKSFFDVLDILIEAEKQDYTNREKNP